MGAEENAVPWNKLTYARGNGNSARRRHRWHCRSNSTVLFFFFCLLF